MTSIDSIKEAIAPDLTNLNRLIREQLHADNPLMDKVIQGFLTSKGKQIRPIVVMLCARIFGPVTTRVLNAAAAVELLHNASLIHDDVVDESKLRRNAPTINAVWDNHIAVLVGDFFVSTALQQAIATGDIRIVDAIGRLGKLLSLGEIEQIYNARQHSLTEDSYFKIINFKTASLFVACARVGCHAAGASDADTELLAKVAELLGLCFQLRDDVFDYFSSDTVGKPTGNDLREGKVTLPLLYALTRTDHPECAEMRSLTDAEQLTDAQIETLQDYARRLGGIDYTYGRMRDLRDSAAAILAESTLGPAAADLLRLFDYIIDRDF
ncbi:MAG: polyprenyl synthetase family protein [Muribaculaceae bacterium]|nr:polyprenyl synthetase family protein [Muribaculaceae bacterium]